MTDPGVHALQYPETSAVCWSSPQHPTTPSHMRHKKEGFFYTSMRRHDVASSFNVILPTLAAAVQCSSSPSVSKVRWAGYKREQQSEACVWVAGGINTICCSLLQFCRFLNTLQGPWEIQRQWTSFKLLHVLRSSQLLSLNICACQAEAAW